MKIPPRPSGVVSVAAGEYRFEALPLLPRPRSVRYLHATRRKERNDRLKHASTVSSSDSLSWGAMSHGDDEHLVSFAACSILETGTLLVAFFSAASRFAP